MQIGLGGILTILFVALKLTEVIDWSWFWVVSPLIFSIGITVIVIIGASIIAVYKN